MVVVVVFQSSGVKRFCLVHKMGKFGVQNTKKKLQNTARISIFRNQLSYVVSCVQWENLQIANGVTFITFTFYQPLHGSLYRATLLPTGETQIWLGAKEYQIFYNFVILSQS